jgi:AcrR family transcriptional regulator
MPRPTADGFVADAVLAMLTSEPAGVAPSPVPERPSWSPTPSRREEIMRVALGLFRAHGFGGVGIGEIGDHAGVGASNVHRYFAAKEDILVDLYDRVWATVHVRIDDAIAAADDAADALDRMIHAYCQVAFDAADLVVVVTQSRGALPAGERPRLRRRDRRIMDLWRTVVAEVRPDLRPNEVATVVAGILPMVNMYPQVLAADLPDIDLVAPLVRAFVLGAGR